MAGLFAGCSLYGDVKSVKQVLTAQFPDNTPKVDVRNGRSLVIAFESPPKNAINPQGVATLVAQALPSSTGIDSVEVVIAEYEAKAGPARAALERRSSFAVRDLRNGARPRIK
jgi:hypothetical protein